MVNANDYTCGFWKELGPIKADFLVFSWKNNAIPASKYKLKYTLSTPAQVGHHHLSIKTMHKYYPIIINIKNYSYIYTTEVDTWATNYPKLFYSFN